MEFLIFMIINLNKIHDKELTAKEMYEGIA